MGVGALAEVAEAGEDAEGGGEWEVELLEADGYFGGEDGAGGGAVEGDVGGLVGLEEVAVDGDGVVDGGGKFVLGREAVEDGDDAGVGEVGDGDGLGEGAGVGVEAAAVDVDEDAVRVLGVEWEDVADGDAGDGDGFDLDWVGFEGGFAGAGLPGVGAGAALGEGLVFGSGGAAEGGLGLGTDGGGDGDDAGDVRGAVGVEGAGVGLGWLLGLEGGGEGGNG